MLPLYPQYVGRDHRLDDRRRGRRAADLALGAGDPHHPPLPRRSRLHPGAGGQHPRGLGARRAAEKLLFSFHGIPQRYFLAGDPYFCECHKLARLAAEELQLPRERWEVSFQSLFGKEEWLKPYTDKTIAAMAKSGIRGLDVVCPGFSADCLETIEEIDDQNREIFLHAGGERYRYIPALTTGPTTSASSLTWSSAISRVGSSPPGDGMRRRLTGRPPSPDAVPRR